MNVPFNVPGYGLVTIPSEVSTGWNWGKAGADNPLRPQGVRGRMKPTDRVPAHPSARYSTAPPSCRKVRTEPNPVAAPQLSLLANCLHGVHQ